MRMAIVPLAVFMTASIASAAVATKPAVQLDRRTGQVVLTSGRLELRIDTRQGLNPRQLRDLKSGRLLADSDYVWPGGRAPKLLGAPKIENGAGGGGSVVLKGQLGEIVVEQSFTVPAGEPGAIIERLTISNPTDKPTATTDFKCGFAKQVREGDKWVDDATAIHFSPVPYRRETDGTVTDLPLREAVGRGMSYSGWGEPVRPTPTWGSEGWTWSDRSNTLLIAKFNSDAMEWSLLESLRRGTTTVVRFGGAGQWKHGSPEAAAQLAPGKSYAYGETWLQMVDGDWIQGFYAYRHYTEAKGIRPHEGYNPPVHWNELYDCPYFFVAPNFFDKNADPPALVANQTVLKYVYTLEAMKAEAAKAKEIGAEALYLDPGWDTGPSHHIWGADRLGPMDAFVKMLREEYRLKLSLWIGTAGVPATYGDPAACPIEARVVGPDGRRTDLQCFASPAFLNTKTERLLELCRNGAAFMMFDSTQYTGPCYDKTHGHSIPSTREEHARALLELTQRVKSKYPQLLIEEHDYITGPGGAHYTPTYFQYDKPHSFDCIWGQEFMWDSWADLVEKRALSLYYYNLAYSLPVYLHINLKNDNENALVFWWYASTIRHLGIGGKSTNASVWAADKNAMRTYLPLKRFYTQGVFYGLDEMVHVHTLPDLKEAVINSFNLEDKPVEKQVRFRLADIGLPAGKATIDGAPFTVNGDAITLTVATPAKGHRLVRVRAQ